MQTSLDLSRWRERPRGVGWRRWAIVSTGVARLARGGFFRVLLVISWTVGALAALTGFLFSQAVAVGGGLDEFLGNFGPRGLALAFSIRALVLLYPDVCVRSLFTALFWAQTTVGLWLSLLALTALLSGLVTRDRASNALVVYLSRPLTSADYLIGKLGIVVGVLVLLWTGPLAFSWLLSVLFASDRDFLVYSVMPLLRALLFNGIGLLALASIAMGVSAIAKSARATVVVWLCLWLVAGFVANVPRMPAWVQRASFMHDLGQIRRECFRLDEALIDAGDSLPLTDRRFADRLDQAGRKAEPTDLGGCVAGLLVLGGLSSLVYFRRLRPE